MDQDKYPENFFEHFIVSLSTTGETPDQNGFDRLVRLYMDIEGMDVFKELVMEIEQIKKNNDIPFFMSVVEDFEIEGLDQAGLEAMAETAIRVYKELTAAS